MTRRTQVLLTMMVLALPGVVMAGHRHSERNRHTRAPMSLELLALEFEEASEMTYWAARRGTFHAGYRQARTLDRLRELQRESRRFRRRVERYGYAPHRIDREFYRLERKYRAASLSLERNHRVHPRVWARVRAMNRSMVRLERALYGARDYAETHRYRPRHADRRYYAHTR